MMMVKLLQALPWLINAKELSLHNINNRKIKKPEGIVIPQKTERENWRHFTGFLDAPPICSSKDALLEPWSLRHREANVQRRTE